MTPELVKLNDEAFLVIWEEYNTTDNTYITKFATINSSAQIIASGRTNIRLSDCQPVFCSDGIVRWYTSSTVSNSTIVYSVNPYHLDTIGTITTVSKVKTPVVTAPKANSLIYTGKPQALISAGSTTGGTLLYSTDDETYSETVPTETDAGSYTVYYKVVGNTYYSDVDAESVNVTITKATPTVTAPTAKTLTYTGDAQVLVTAGKTTGGTIMYSLDNKIYSTGIPSGTDAGNYKVYYKVVGGANINDVAAKSVEVTIAKAVSKVTPTVTAPKAKSLKYTGKAQDLVTAGKTTGGILNYSLDNKKWSTKIPTGTNIGRYTVYYKVVGDSGYNSVASKSVKVTIVPAAVKISSLKNSASKTLLVKWSKNSKATGYQIQYSTSSKFKSAKTVTIIKNSTVSKKITKLTKGKTYYVRVRAYKTVNNVKYYSSWCAVKSCKISK